MLNNQRVNARPEKETPENETLRVDGPLQILTESVLD